MQYYSFRNEKLSPLGMGGVDINNKPEASIKAFRYGLKHGINIIDTAEMYNGSEEVVGKAIKPLKRDSIFLVSKVLPSNATANKMKHSLHESLRKLQTDYLDLYLLHWRDHVNLSEVVHTMEVFQKEGLIRHWGVSNFDTSDMKDLFKIKNGDHAFANEDLYNITSRGVEYDLIPWQKEKQVVFLSYSPFHAVGWHYLKPNDLLKQIADNHHATAYQIMLAWIMQSNFVIPLPKASSINHVKANIAAANIKLTADELAAIDKKYPAPDHKVPLQKI